MPGKGRPFQKGQISNPAGRKPRVVEKEYTQAVQGTVSAEDMGRVAKVLLKLAEAGELGPAKLLFDYLIAKPAQAIELTQHREVLEWDDRDTDATPSLGAEQREEITGQVQSLGMWETVGEIEAGRSVDSEGGT